MVPTVRGSTHQRLVIFLQHPTLPIVIILMQSDFLLWNGYYGSYQFSIIDDTLYQEKPVNFSVRGHIVSPNVILQPEERSKVHNKTGCKNIFLIFDILAGTTPHFTERPMKELAKYRILFTNYRPQPKWKPLWIRFKLNIGVKFYPRDEVEFASRRLWLISPYRPFLPFVMKL